MPRIGRGIQQQAFVTPALADQGDGTSYGAGSGSNIGPHTPAEVTNASNPPVVTTLDVNLAVDRLDRGHGRTRRFPLQGWDGGLTRATSLSDGGTQIVQLRSPLLGPKPPQLVTPLPTQRQQTITVALASQSRRISEKRRFPLPGWVDVQAYTDVPTAISGLIDDFNRAALGPDWVTPVFGFAGSITITSNVACSTSGSTIAVRAEPFGPYCEVAVDSVTAPVASFFNLGLNAQPAGPNASDQNGYDVQFAQSGGAITLIKVVKGSGSTLGTGSTAAGVAAGNSYRLRREGTRLTVWVKKNGATPTDWLLAISVSDSTFLPDVYYPYIRTSVFATGANLDNFSGGSIPQTSVVYRSPFLGPKPPLILAAPISQQQQTINQGVAFDVAVMLRAQAQRRAPKSLLFPVGTLAQPPPLPEPVSVTTVAVSSSRVTRVRRRTVAGIAPPQVFNAPPSQRIETVQTWLTTGAVGASRNTSARLAMSVLYGPTVVSSPIAENVAVAVARTRPRRTFSRLAPPAVITTAVFVASPIRVDLVKTRPRPTTKTFTTALYLRPLAVVTTPGQLVVKTKLTRTRPRRTTATLFGFVPAATGFVAPLISVNLQDNRLRGFGRRHFPSSLLSPPTVLQTFQGPSVNLLSIDRFNRRHRRPPMSNLGPPFFYAQTSEILVGLAHARPRKTRTFLSPPTVLQIFQGPRTWLAHTRPRPTVHVLGEPQAVRVPSVEHREQTISVTLVRTRPRPTTKDLGQPQVINRAVYNGPLAPLVHTRPRPTRRFFQTTVVEPYLRAPDRRLEIVSELARIRPRHTVWLLAPPATLTPYSIELAEDTIRVDLVHTRPRHTLGTRLGYTVYPQTSEVVVAAVRTRPRETRYFLAPPQVVRVPSVEQAEQTIRVDLVRARPRPTTKTLGQPQALQVFAGPVEAEVAVRIPVEDRRRLPHSKLSPPAVVIPVGQIYYGPAVHLARIRPRPTVGTKLGYTVYSQTSRILVALTRIRPRPTVRRLAAVFYSQTSEIVVTLVHTRPRKTRAFLPPPTTLQEFFGPVETEVAVRIPLEDKRRPAHSFLRPPQVVRVPSVEQQEQTIRVDLVRTRPRPTVRRLQPPTIVAAPPQAPVKVATVRRVTRPAHSVLRPPTVVIPLPTQRMQTIQVALARIRPRPTRRTLGPLIFYPQTSSISVTRAFRTRLEAQRRAPRSFLAEPAVVAKAAFYGPFVWLTHTRPRPTVKTLGEPQVVRVPSVEQKLRTLAISLVRTRPRPTIHVLGEPTVVSTPPVETVVAVTLTHARPKPTSKTLGEPQTLRVFAGPSVHTVATRPRPTSRFLRIPTKVRVPSVEQAEQTIRVTLARIRPRPTSKVLGEPTVLQVFFGPLVRLVRIRPRPTVVRKIVQGAYRLPDRSQSTIRVVLNGRIQREAVRRGPHTRIFPPTTLAARRIAILVLTVVLVAVKDALRRNRRQPKYRIVPPTAVRAQNLYFKAGLPESGWATGRLTCVGADYTVCPPESGWATGRMSVDIQTDDTDQDWSAGKPL